MSDVEHFEELVKQALDALPDQFASMLDNIFVEVEETPSTDDLASVGMAADEGDDLLGLYQGTPLKHRGAEYSGLPDRIVLYRRSILLECESDDAVRQEVYDTVIHELGHHFGLSDDEMIF